MNAKALMFVLVYGMAFILGLGFVISLELKDKKRLVVRLLSIIVFFSFVGFFYYGDKKFNYDFEYLDLNNDGDFEYKYRVIDLHSCTAGWSEIFRVEFYEIDSSKVIGIEVYWNYNKRSDSFEPWDYESIDGWETKVPAGMNNWMDMQGWIL